MNGDAAPANVVLGAIVVLLGLAVSVAVWAWLATWKLRGRAWTPFQRRRSVPWDFLIVGVVVCVYLMGNVLGAVVARSLAGDAAWPPPSKAAASNKAAEPRPAAQSDAASETPSDGEKPSKSAPSRPGSEHVLVILLRENPSGWVIALCAVSAVVIAPLWEEIFFRLVLQGWLERIETRLARVIRIPGRLRGVMPITISAFLFALPHVRFASSQLPSSQLLTMVVVHTLVSVTLIVLVLAILRAGAGANAIDLGWDGRRWCGDAVRGLVAFAAIMAPLYLLQAGLKLFLQSRGLATIAPDPAPIFVLALVLGYLYYRTHRLAAPVAMHMALNATTMGLFFLSP